MQSFGKNIAPAESSYLCLDFKQRRFARFADVCEQRFHNVDAIPIDSAHERSVTGLSAEATMATNAIDTS